MSGGGYTSAIIALSTLKSNLDKAVQGLSMFGLLHFIKDYRTNNTILVKINRSRRYQKYEAFSFDGILITRGWDLEHLKRKLYSYSSNVFVN
jgi:hypothetical protein